MMTTVMCCLCRQASADLGDRVEVSLDNVTGEASLLVREVTLGDGGLYKCEVTWLDVSQHPSCQQRVVQLVRVQRGHRVVGHLHDGLLELTRHLAVGLEGAGGCGRPDCAVQRGAVF